MPHRGCPGYARLVSDGPRAFFKRPVGHVEHPGPNMSVSHGDAEAQAEQRRLPRHLRHQALEMRRNHGNESKSEVIRVPRGDSGYLPLHPDFYSSGGLNPPTTTTALFIQANRVGGDN